MASSEDKGMQITLKSCRDGAVLENEIGKDIKEIQQSQHLVINDNTMINNSVHIGLQQAEQSVMDQSLLKRSDHQSYITQPQHTNICTYYLYFIHSIYTILQHHRVDWK